MEAQGEGHDGKIFSYPLPPDPLLPGAKGEVYVSYIQEDNPSPLGEGLGRG